jgi:hypothetical protein
LCSCLFSIPAVVSFAASGGCHGRPAPDPVPREASVTSPASRVPDRPAVAWSQGPFASATVPPGELAGVVVDAETGRPLPLVQLGIIAPGDPVMTDSSGRFVLRLPNVPVSVRVRRIGYEALTIPVTPREDSGSAAVFAIHPAPVTLCQVTVGGGMGVILGPNGRRTYLPPRVERHPGVVVTVRDALTGRAPPGVIAVSVRDSTFSDSVVARSDSDDRAVATAALDRSGRYDVTVRSDGYREWTGSASTRIASECGGELIPAVFHVWLIPR